jgi:hypothetical protein
MCQMLSLVIDGFLLFYASPALTHQFDLILALVTSALLRVRHVQHVRSSDPRASAAPLRGTSMPSRLGCTKLRPCLAFCSPLRRIMTRGAFRSSYIFQYWLNLCRDEVDRPGRDSIAGLDDVLNTLRKVGGLSCFVFYAHGVALSHQRVRNCSAYTSHSFLCAFIYSFSHLLADDTSVPLLIIRSFDMHTHKFSIRIHLLVRSSTVSMPLPTVSKDEKVAVVNHALIQSLQQRVVALTYNPHSRFYIFFVSDKLNSLQSFE